MNPKHEKQITPEEIRNLCQAWQEEHGKINETNFVQCLANIVKKCGNEPRVISDAGRIIYEMGNIKQCSCCGRAPAFEKQINGDPILLCVDCQALVIFQDLGPGEGYV
jgi:hypothetical protein